MKRLYNVNNLSKSKKYKIDWDKQLEFLAYFNRYVFYTMSNKQRGKFAKFTPISNKNKSYIIRNKDLNYPSVKLYEMH